MFRNAPIVCPTGMGMISYVDALCWVTLPQDVCATCRGNPIRPGRGAKVFNETDAVDPAGPLTFSRSHSSFGFNPPSNASATPLRVLGRMWATPFDSDLVPILGSSYVIAAIVRPDGGIKYFRQDGSEYPHFATTAVETLTHNTDGTWTFISGADQVKTYDAQARLTGIWDRSGLQRILGYDANGNLQSVTDSRGRTLLFSIVVAADHSRTTTVTTPAGQQYVYALDPLDNLLDVTFPGGAIRQYVYENASFYNAITGVIEKASASDPGTRYETVQYDQYGRATSSFLAPDIAGGTIGRNTFTFSGNATITTQVDPLGNSTTLQFTDVNGALYLTSQDQPCAECGRMKSAAYDAAGYPQQDTDFNGGVTNHTYDDVRGLETQRIEAYGTTSQRTINTTWNASFRVPDQRTVINNAVPAAPVTESATRWAYNTRGQVLSRCEVDPTVSGAMTYTCGSSTNAPTGVRQSRYTYCESSGVTAGTCPIVGLVLSADGARTDVTDVTSYTYYQTTDVTGCASGGTCHYLGDLYQITNALSQVTTYVTYDKNGRVTRIKDANGTYTDMSYHPRGWLQTRTVRANSGGTPSSGDATTSFGYDNVGNVTQITQPDGAYLSYTYDAAHRLTDITDNLTNTIHYTLDAAGNRTQEDTKDPSATLKRSLSRQYDSLNRLIKTLNATSVAVQTYQNPVDAPPTGVTYTDGYDGNGNAIYSVDGLNAGTEQLYDPLNRLVKTLQDHTGLSTATQDTTTQYTYDARDNLRSVTDPDNLTTNYTYDGLNNLTALSGPDTGASSYTYDAAGNRHTQTDARGVTTTYAYDALNRLTGMSYPTSGLNVTYTYDQPQTGCYNVGRLTTITDSSGSTGYCYDRRGNVVTKQQTTASVVSTLGYSYNLADRLSTITYPSGAIVTYTRNSIGQITAIGYQVNSGASSVSLVQSATYLPFGPLNVLTFGNGRSLTKSYDSDYAIDQVVSSSASGLVIDATVDVLGNLVNASSTVGASPPTQKYLYDPLYRLTTSETGAATPSLLEVYTYGKTGDRTSAALGGGSATTYAYTSSTHHLSTVGSTSRSYDASGNTQGIGSAAFTYDDRNRLTVAGGATYAYSGKGERVGKTLSGSTTTFVYGEGGQLMGEYTAGGGKEYFYLDGTPVGLATTGTTPQLYYVETDQLGTPREVIQPGAPDTVVWKWDYFSSTFGTNTPSPQTLTVNLRFPGQYFDSETGLNYNGERYFEPEIGRYPQSDPIGLAGGISTYAYVVSNPQNAIDPTGTEGFGSWSFPPPAPPAHCSCEDIVNIAMSMNNDSRFAYASNLAAFGGFGANSNKCNLFIYYVLSPSGFAPRRWGGFGGPLSAGDWGDPNVKIPHFPIVASPQPGDVAAMKHDYSDASGHAAIVIKPGQSSVGAGTYGSHTTGWPWDPSLPPFGNPVFRHCTCGDSNE